MKQLLLILFTVILLSQIQTFAQMSTVQSGAWQSAATWAGGTIPDSNTNVQIAAGHVITIDDSASVCKSITFADTSAQLKMTATTSMLRVYGDFTLFSTAHKAFSAWTAGAKIIFTGSALKQTLSGWNTAGSSTSFMEMIVDKDTGKVATGRQNMRFSFGTSLEIKRGIFELDSLDDIETRTIGGTGTDGIITVYSKGTFQMVGGTSHIRKGTFTDTITSRIGKLTVYGKAVLSSASSNRMNFSGIEIMDGGLVNLNTGGSANYFNPGTIVVHNGGVLQNSTTTAIYHPSAYIVLEQGGEFNSGTSTTPLPVNGINATQGIVRYSRSSDQTLPAGIAQYNNLYLSGGGIKTFGANTTVTGTLSLRGSASVNLNGKTLTYGPDAILQYGAPGQTTAQITSDIEFPETNGPRNVSIYNTGGVTLHANRTVPGTLTLSSGVFDNNGSSDDKVLTMGEGSTIRRASGSFSVSPAFSSSVNIAYISTLVQVTTGVEIPSAENVLQNLIISSTKGVELGSNTTVNGTVNFEQGALSITTGAFTLHLGSNASLQGETSTAFVKGKVVATRTIGTAANAFGGVGFEIAAGIDNLTSVTVTRTSGDAGILTVLGKQSIARNWNVVSANQPVSGRTVTCTWPSADDNGKVFTQDTRAKAMLLHNTTWIQVDTPKNVHENDPRSFSFRTTELGQFAVLDTLVSVGIEKDEAVQPQTFTLQQNYPNPFNPATSIAFTIGTSEHVALKVFDVLGNTVATLVNQTVPAGTHKITFNGTGLASGFYFAVLKTNTRVQSVKMLLVK